MKLLVALCCVFLTVSASPLLGTEQCAHGPVVWCENIQTASQCGAVKHCQQTVWNKPTVKTVPCDMCKEVLTVVDNFLKDNCSESEVEDFLTKLCDLIPGVSSTCKDLVTSYFPLLYDMLIQELNNPGVICQALHVCQSLQPYLASLKSPQHLQTNEIPELDSSEMVHPFIANVPLLLFPQEKVQQESMTGDVCKDCLTLVTDLQDTLRSNTSYYTYLVNRALKECDALGGGLSDMCKTYVNQYADYVLQAVLQMSQPAQQLCNLLALCETQSPPQVLTPAEIIPAVKLQPAMKIGKEPSVQLNPKCEVCELIVRQLEKLLEGNETKQAIEKALEKVCFILPKKNRQKCIDFMDAYSNAILELLEQEVGPKEVCCILGICSRKQRSNIVKLDPTVVTSGGYCKICKMAVSYMDVLLEKNVTEERIQDMLKKVCNYLPETVQDQCCSMVAQYEPLFIEYLLQALDPDFVCGKLGLCLSKLPLLGTDKCTRGPSYWCKDMDTAAMCNAIQHCKRHVWV